MKKQEELKDNYIYKEYEPYINTLEQKEKSYIINRLVKQIIWYDKEAARKQKRYKGWTMVSILLTAIIPSLSLMTNYKYGIIASLAIALLSGGSSAILSILNLCELQKLWIEYRTNCEILKSLLHRYLTKTGEFSEDTNNKMFNRLICTAEDYLIKDCNSWSKLDHSYENKQK